ncbi:MAG: Mur ligase family protein [Verrucomicrobiota bacterium]
MRSHIQVPSAAGRIRFLVRRATYAASARWRGLLGRVAGVRFIGVTGSAGKTTTTKLIGACLRVAGRVRDTDRMVGQLNGQRFAAHLVLTTTPFHRFCVSEFGIGGPGMMASYVEVMPPDIGVVTNVAWDHYSAFRGLEVTAREKRVLIEALPPHGTAVLNGDDPNVLGMRLYTRARILTFGLSDGAEVRGEKISAVWPDRLSLTVRHGTERVRVTTRLVGGHFAHPVLGALATAVAAGVPLADAARALETVEPVDGRYSVHTVRGVTFIRDDWKAPLWSIPAALQFLGSARARRKIFILGTISDYPGDSSQKYRAVVRQAVPAADHVFFVGRMAHCALRARDPSNPDRVAAFDTLLALHQYLEGFLQDGDLVLIKGSAAADHLQRLVLARAGDNQCWRPACGRAIFCSDCALRRQPEHP